MEMVNGEPRQVFEFSKPDAPAKFYAPVRIGTGYRRRIELAQSGSIIQDPKWVNMATSLIKGRTKPHGMSDAAWQEQLQIELKELILSNIHAEDLGVTPDEDLIILETLLVPAPGSMPVKTWYFEFAEDSEVQEVVNFSKGTAADKTTTTPLTVSSGKATTPKAKGGR